LREPVFQEFSQEALADKLGVAPNTISTWETGTYEPTLNDLEALSRELSVSILDFFPRVETKDEKTRNVEALLRSAQKDAADLVELRRYAEFRRARSMYTPKRVWAGSANDSMLRSQYYEALKNLARETRAEYGIASVRVLRSDLRRIYSDQGIRIDLWDHKLKNLRGAYLTMSSERRSC